MTRHGESLRRLAQGFVDGRKSFWEFHEAFLERWTRLAPDRRAEAAREGWNEVYGWVLSAVADPVSEEDGVRGVVGEAELRNRLRRHPLLASPR